MPLGKDYPKFQAADSYRVKALKDRVIVQHEKTCDGRSRYIIFFRRDEEAATDKFRRANWYGAVCRTPWLLM